MTHSEPRSGHTRSHGLRLLALGAATALAPLAAAAQTPAAPTPPAASSVQATTAAPVSPEVSLRQMLALLPAQPDEYVLIPALRGIVLVDNAADAERAAGGGAGVDTSRVPNPALADLGQIAPHLIGKPASLPSLERIATLVRAQLRLAGQRSVLVYLPPQSLAGDSVRIVVQPVRLDGPVQLEGVTHFSSGQYSDALGLKVGEPINDAQVDAATARINRNPFRQAVVVAQPGTQPGTTRLTLRVQERRPLSFNAGIDNSGSRATGQNRLWAGLTWGDAFGRGDQLGYSYKADPQDARMVSHSASYTTNGHHGTTSVNVLWSRLKPDLGPLFGQVGHSWQISARHAWEAPAPSGWTAQWSLGPDIKVSDNTIEFAAIPVVNNRTRIVQMVGSYSVQRETRASATELALSTSLSPGRLGRSNDDVAFGGSRFGAQSRYAVARADMSHRAPLGVSGWSWRASGSLQMASGALLGSEQLAGAGAATVRALRESAIFGDSGLVASLQVHLPPLTWKDAHNLDSFVFIDGARLRQRAGAPSSTASGAGAGLNYAWSGGVSVRASYGRVIDRPAGYDGNGRWNVTARVVF